MIVKGTSVRVIAGCVTAWASVIASPQSANAENILYPTKPWVLNYAETQCLASRAYGDWAFGIRPAPNGETYELLALDHRTGPHYGVEFHGSVDFGHGPIAAWGLVFRADTPNTRMYHFRIPASDMEQARSASSVTLRGQNQIEQSFALDNMPQLLDGFRKCIDDLKHYWNMTPNESARFAKHARGDLRILFSGSDYPDEAYSRYQEGTVQFLLLVNEQGGVSDCDVLKPSGSPSLDVQGCHVIMERAHFTPARGVDGNPLRDAVVTPPISWRLSP